MYVAGTTLIAAGIDDFLWVFIFGIASSRSILLFVPLNKTDFDRLALLLPWVQTWIGVNNTDPLKPEGWFKYGHGMKGRKKNDDGIFIPYLYKSNFYEGPPLQWQTWC